MSAAYSVGGTTGGIEPAVGSSAQKQMDLYVYLCCKEAQSLLVDYTILAHLEHNPTNDMLNGLRDKLVAVPDGIKDQAKPMITFIDDIVKRVEGERRKVLQDEMKNDLEDIEKISGIFEDILYAKNCPQEYLELVQNLQQELVGIREKGFLEKHCTAVSVAAGGVGGLAVEGVVIANVVQKGFELSSALHLDTIAAAGESAVEALPQVGLTAAIISSLTHSAATWNRRQGIAGLAGFAALSVGGVLVFGPAAPLIIMGSAVLGSTVVVEAVSSDHSPQLVRDQLGLKRKRGHEEITKEIKDFLEESSSEGRQAPAAASAAAAAIPAAARAQQVDKGTPSPPARKMRRISRKKREMPGFSHENISRLFVKQGTGGK